MQRAGRWSSPPQCGSTAPSPINAVLSRDRDIARRREACRDAPLKRRIVYWSVQRRAKIDREAPALDPRGRTIPQRMRHRRRPIETGLDITEAIFRAVLSPRRLRRRHRVDSPKAFASRMKRAQIGIFPLLQRADAGRPSLTEQIKGGVALRGQSRSVAGQPRRACEKAIAASPVSGRGP